MFRKLDYLPCIPKHGGVGTLSLLRFVPLLACLMGLEGHRVKAPG